MNVTYQHIETVNREMQTVNIKGKEYAEVHERIKAFRKLYPAGGIETKILHHNEGFVVIQATAKTADGHILGQGTAYEREGSSFINKTSYIENCETSAVGRALGMAGVGIDSSIASAQEVRWAQGQQAGQQAGQQQRTGQWATR